MTAVSSPAISVTNACHLRLARILVGTDFSAPAAKALKIAALIAQAYGSEMLIANAVPVILPETGVEGMTPRALDYNLQSAREKLESVIAQEPELRHIRRGTFLSCVEPVDFIPRIARENHVGMIVLGSHGAHGLERLLLGSTAQAILRVSECPVLIAGPLAECRHSPLRSVLFAADLKRSGRQAAHYAAALAKRNSGALTMLHVINGHPPALAADRTRREMEISLELAQLVPEQVADCCRFSTMIAYGDPAEEIVAAAISRDASLIVVGEGKHTNLADHLPWLTLSRIIQQAPCGVLVPGGFIERTSQQ